MKKVWVFIRSFWSYLGKSQDKNFRLLHLAIAFLIILQIIDSDFIEVYYQTLNYGAYFHIICGLTIAVLSIFLFLMALDKRGVRYYYPYLFSNYVAIKIDLAEISRFRLPNVRSGSIAAIIQGLGLLSLFIAWGSGLIWFITWNLQLGYEDSIRSLHQNLVGLVEIYICCHGIMGIVHFIFDKFFPKFISNIKD